MNVDDEDSEREFCSTPEIMFGKAHWSFTMHAAIWEPATL